MPQQSLAFPFRDDYLIRRIHLQECAVLNGEIRLSPLSYLDEGLPYVSLSFFLSSHFHHDMKKVLEQCCGYPKINKAIIKSTGIQHLTARNYYDYGYRLASIPLAMVIDSNYQFKTLPNGSYVSPKGHVDIVDGQATAAWFSRKSKLLSESEIF